MVQPGFPGPQWASGSLVGCSACWAKCCNCNPVLAGQFVTGWGWLAACEAVPGTWGAEKTQPPSALYQLTAQQPDEQ